MSKIANWEIKIETEAISANVLATTSCSALKEADFWAKKQGVIAPKVSMSVMIDLPADMSNVDDEISDALEWTSEEEEAFLHKVDEQKDQ